MGTSSSEHTNLHFLPHDDSDCPRKVLWFSSQELGDTPTVRNKLCPCRTHQRGTFSYGISWTFVCLFGHEWKPRGRWLSDELLTIQAVDNQSSYEMYFCLGARRRTCREEIEFFQFQNSGKESGLKIKEMLSVWHDCRKDTLNITALRQNSHFKDNGIIWGELPEDFTHTATVTQQVLIPSGKKPYHTNLMEKPSVTIQLLIN